MGGRAARRKRKLAPGGEGEGTPERAADRPETARRFGRLRRAALSVLAVTTFLAPIAILPELRNPSWYPKAAVLVTGSLAALALWLGSLWTADRTLRRAPLTLPVLLFAGWSALSISWATNPHESLRIVAVWWAAAIAFVAASQAAREVSELSPIFAAAFWSGAAVALLGFFGPPLGIEAVAHGHRLGSTFVNQNPAGHHVAMTMPFGVLLLLARPAGVRAWLRAAALGVMAAFVIQTGAKAAWVAILAQACVLAVVHVLRGRRLAWPGAAVLWRPLALTLVIAVSLVVSLSLSRGTASVPAEMGELLLPTGSLISRIAIWRNTAAMIRERPLVGVGAGNFPIVFPRFEDTVVRNPLSRPGVTAGMAHQDYLQVTADLGLIGLALLAVFFAAAARQAIALLRPAEGPLPWPALGALLLLVSFAVIAAVDFPMYIATPPFLAAIALAALAVGGAGDHRRIGPIPRWVAGLACAAAAAVGVPWSIAAHARHIRGDHHLWRADGAVRKARWDIALVEADRALKASPGQPEALLIRGRALRHLGRYDDCAATTEAALAINPHDYGLYMQLGSCLRYRKHFDRALKVFERGKRLRPDWPAAHAGDGLTLLDMGRAADAAAAFERARGFERDPVERARNTFNLAVARQQQGDARAARDTYVQALGEGVDGDLRARALLTAGVLSRQLGEWDAAERYLSESLATDTSGAAHLHLGDRRLEQGRQREAAEHFEAVLALGAKRAAGELDRLAALRLGSLYQRLQDWPAAARAWERALELDPGSQAAQRGLEVAHRRLAGGASP